MSSSPTESSRAEAAVAVTMPQMGVSVAEGTITEWRKQPGDWVEADETVCEVTTDKIDVEIPSPAAGRLERILVEPGETVAVGTALAEIDPGARPGEPHRDESDGAATAREREAAAATAAEPGADRAPRGGEIDRSRFYSPVVRRIAAEHGVDLAQVEGTGVGGRIRKRDLVAHIEAGDGERAAEPAERPLHIESPYRPEEPTPATAEPGPSVPEPAVTTPAASAEELIGPTRREPMSAMRRQIARHMVESRRTAAHCTTVVEVDFSAVAARRRELIDEMARRGVRLTYLAFVAQATVATLAEHPTLNASVDGDELVHHEDINLGIAVALEGGLIVPVIRKAQRLSLEGMAAAINDCAERARSGRLEPDEVHGGTFTITNPGQFGAVVGTPIINQPQVAILDLEAVVKRPVVVEGPDGDSIGIRPMSYMCMSWDHRALDGAEAARFLSAVRQRLEGVDV